jgi:hypothetical protein
MTGVSRNERHGWSRMGVSLMVGLVLFLCVKASVREEEEMQEFLLKCGKLSEGEKFTRDMDLETLEKLMIDVVEASKIQIPGEWGAVLKSLDMLMLTGPIPEAGDDDMQQEFFLLDEEVETLGLIVSKVREVPTLTCLSLQDMNMRHLPAGIWTDEKVDMIMLIGVACCRTSIPENFQAEHITEFTVKEFVCGRGGDGLPHLLHGMSKLHGLVIEHSDMRDVISFGEGKLSLRNLEYLEIAMLETKAVEDLIKCVDVEKLKNLEELKITGVDLGDLELLKGMNLLMLKKLSLFSTKTKSLENVKGEDLPFLRSLALRGNLDLRLDENMCKCELLQKIKDLEVEMQACEEGMDMGRRLSNLERVIFYEGGVEIVEVEYSGKSKEKLRVVLNVENIGEEGVRSLGIFRGSTRKEMKVVINAGQIQLSKRLIIEIMKVFEECRCLETFDLEIKTEREAPCVLEIMERLKNRERFRLEWFKVKGVNVPQHAMGQLGGYMGDFSGVEGRWDEESSTWKMRGFSRTLHIHPVKMFETWVLSKENQVIRGRDGLRGTREPCETNPTRECMVCGNNVRGPEMKQFAVLNCGHWKCVGCAKKLCKKMNQEQSDLCTKIEPVFELECSSCRETFEYAAGKPSSANPR